jgi:hypothetical protein
LIGFPTSLENTAADALKEALRATYTLGIKLAGSRDTVESAGLLSKNKVSNCIDTAYGRVEELPRYIQRIAVDR